MKKALSIILAMLMVFSLASCGGKTPDAKELYVNAYKDIKSYGIDMDMEFSMTAEGETIGITFGMDGEMDANRNLKLKYSLGETSTGMSYSGDAYLMMNDLDFYIQFVGTWMSITKDDFTLLLGDSFVEEYSRQLEGMPAANAELIDEMGIVFSEVTEKDGIYYFDCSYSDKTVDYILNMSTQMSGDEADFIKATFEESGIKDLLKELKISTGIDKKTGNLVSMSCDMTKVMNNSLKAGMDAAIAEDPELAEVEIDFSVQKAAFNITYSNINGVADITVPDDVKANSMGVMDLLQVMMMGYGM